MLEAGTRLILNDGTVLEDCDCGYYNKTLWCFLRGITFAEAFQHFSNPEKFSKITLEYDFEAHYRQTIYSGFTSLTGIEQREFSVDVRLEGPVIDIEEKRIDKSV